MSKPADFPLADFVSKFKQAFAHSGKMIGGRKIKPLYEAMERRFSEGIDEAAKAPQDMERLGKVFEQIGADMRDIASRSPQAKMVIFGLAHDIAEIQTELDESLKAHAPRGRTLN